MTLLDLLSLVPGFSDDDIQEIKPAPRDSTRKITRYRLYQAVAQPILPPDLQPEQVTVSSWWVEWRTPRWSRKPLVEAPFSQLDPTATMAAESITLDKWEIGWRTPVWRVRPRIHTDPSAILDSGIIGEDPVAQFRPFEVPLSIPVRPPFRAYYYPWHTLDLEPNQQAEEVTVDRFYSPFSQPLFPVSRRYTSHLRPFHVLVLTEFDETIYVASFDSSFGGPVLHKRSRPLEPMGQLELEPNQQPETVFMPAWFRPFGMPVLPPRRPLPHLDAALLNPDLFPMPGILLLDRPTLAAGFMWF